MKQPWFTVDIKLKLTAYTLAVSINTHTRALGIYGPSGAGKSSLVEALAGLREGTTGHIQILGKTWLDTRKKCALPPHKRTVGWVPQDHRLFPHWDVLRNLKAGWLRVGASTEARDQRLKDVIQILELGELLSRKPDQLSGGERQRVSLGRALCSHPEILILDEPLASLDTRLRQRLLAYLRAVQQEFTLPLIVISHDMTELQALCEEIYILKRGRIIDHGPPTPVFTRLLGQASQDEGRSFINVIPIFPAEQKPEDPCVQVRIGHPDKGPTLELPHTPFETHKHAILHIAADDIILAKTQMNAISARNQLAAKIVDIQPHQNVTWITSKVVDEGPELVVAITRSALEDLALQVSEIVYLIIKSQALQLRADHHSKNANAS